MPNVAVYLTEEQYTLYNMDRVKFRQWVKDYFKDLAHDTVKRSSVPQPELKPKKPWYK